MCWYDSSNPLYSPTLKIKFSNTIIKEQPDSVKLQKLIDQITEMQNFLKNLLSDEWYKDELGDEISICIKNFKEAENILLYIQAVVIGEELARIDSFTK